MKDYLGKIEIEGKLYSANLQSDLKSKFILKILDYSFENQVKIDLVIGLFEGLGEVSLISGYASKGTFGKLDIQEFNFYYLIKGIHFNKIGDIKANILNFQSEILKNVFHKSLLSLNGIIEAPDKSPIQIVETDKLKIDFYDYLSKSYNRNLEFKAFQYKYLNIKVLGGAVPIWDLIQIAGRVKKLIFLLGFSDKDTSDEYQFFIDEGRDKKKFELYGWNYKIQNIKFTFFQNHSVNFTDYFDSHKVRDWIFNEDFQDLFDILYERHFLDHISHESSFLNTIFALEKFHRIFVKENATMEQRINFFKKSFQDILPEEINAEKYLKSILLTRISLAHNEEKPNVFKGIDLLYASVYIEAVIVSALLHKLNLDEEKINRLEQFTREMIRDMYYGNKALEYNYPSQLFKTLK